MFELPGGLRVVERRRVARELELLHHLLGAAVFAFEEQRQENFELDDLGRLVFVATGRRRAVEERLEAITRLRVILFLERDLRQVVLRLAELRIDLRRLLERVLRAVEIFLRQQNLTAQIDRRRLIRIGRVRFVDQSLRRCVIALLEGLLGRFKFFLRDRFRLRRLLGRRGQLKRNAGLAGRLLHPSDFIKRFGKQFVQRRRKFLFRGCEQVLGFLLILVLERDRGVRVGDRRRVGRQLKFRQDRIDHVLLPFEEIGQKNFVLDQLRRVALQFRGAALEQAFKTFARFRPIFPEKRNLGEIETGVPEFRIGRQRFLQRDLGLVVLRLAHLDYAAQILRLGEVGLARIDRVQFLQGLIVIRGAEFAKRLVVHRLQLRFGGRNVCRREGTKNQDRDRREFPNVHAETHRSFLRAE